MLSLVLVAALYAAGRVRAGRAGAGRLFDLRRSIAFVGGIAFIVIALLSPLDALADDLFAAHMVEHLLLILIAAPMLVYSRLPAAILWSMPMRWRRGAWLKHASPLRRVTSITSSVGVVWMASNAIILAWHLPAIYDASIANETLHAFEHATLLVTAFSFWALVLEPTGHRRLAFGPAIVFVATSGVISGMLGALLTFASHPFFASHLSTTQAWGLTPLEDQQLAGLIMWVPGSAIYLLAIVWLVVKWLHDAEHRVVRSQAQTRGAAVVA